MSTQLLSEVYALIRNADLPTYQHHLVGRIEQLEQLLCSPNITRIAFHFDPFCDKAGDELKKVCEVANAGGAEVFTYSSSHLEWLENLTIQLGASRHFPKLADIQGTENANGELHNLRSRN